MSIHIRSALIGALIGLLGCIVLFVFGSHSGRGEIGVAALYVFYLYGGVFLSQMYPASRWYGAVVINIPIWVLLKYFADPSSFQNFFWSLVGCIVISYAGALIGLWLLKRKIVLSTVTKVLLGVIPILLLVLATYLLNYPKPIPSDRNTFVGSWKYGSGFELKIMSNGTATITQDINDRSFAYENLNIKVGPSYISSANVEFLGDSMLEIVRHGYYAKDYKIDKYPYPDSTLYKMVLNGVTLVKK